MGDQDPQGTEVCASDLLSALEDAANLTFESIQAAFDGADRDPDALLKAAQGQSASSGETCISIAFLGEFSGQIVLRTGADVACELARALLMMEADEMPTAEETTDCLAEFANIVGGVMKTNALDPHGEYALGLPHIMQSSEDTSGERAGSLLYSQTRGPLFLEIWVEGEGCSSDERD